jgi:hypothetical protein
MQNPITRSLLVILMSICCFQCLPSATIEKKDIDQLDPNFAGYNGVVLIIRNYDNKSGYNAVDRTILKGFKNYYRGEYEIISEKDLPKYTDQEKYRFLVKSGLTSERTGGVNDIRKYTSYSSITMVDRKTNKVHMTRWYDDYKAFKKFPMVFEALRTSK